MAITKLTLIDATTLEAGGKRYACRIGRGGIAKPGKKREGDLKTPSGSFALRSVYYRPDRLSAPATALPITALKPEDGWCDDAASPAYNTAVKLPFEARHEKLWREDHVYDVIVPLGYNDGPITQGAGSAIFMHVMREDGVGTEGCIALKREDLLEILANVGPDTQMVVRRERWSTIIAFVATLIGVLAALHILGTAFFANTRAIYPTYGLPMASVALTAFGLSVLKPRYWLRHAVLLVVPMLIMAVLLSIGLLMERKFDVAWAQLAGVLAVAAFSYAWLGMKLRG